MPLFLANLKAVQGFALHMAKVYHEVIKMTEIGAKKQSIVQIQSVIDALEEMRTKFSNEKVKKTFSNWTKVMGYHFTDIDEYFTIKVEKGQPGSILNEQASNPDIKYEMSGETFLAITRKEMSGMKAYQQKLIKIKGKIPDLMKLQKLDKL